MIDMAVAAGVDAIHVTAYSSTDVATGPTDSYAPHVVGDLSDYAAVVRQRTALPVITFGRFEPHEAEQVLVMKIPPRPKLAPMDTQKGRRNP